MTSAVVNAVKSLPRKLIRGTSPQINGVVCVYKPESLSMKMTKHTIINNLCRDLNKYAESNPRESIVDISGPTNAPMDVQIVPDLTDHPLVIGPRYQIKEIKALYISHLGNYTSGVFLLGINKGCRITKLMSENTLIKAFKIHGVLGRATDTYHCYGKVVEKATFNHVTREKIDRVVAHMQAMHQKKMYEMAGIDIETQTGYELACMGPIKPVNDKIPVLYGIKCVHFEPPNFIIEVQCVNEYELYLHTLIHDIGMQLHTVAHCAKTQCIRFGQFTLEHALLRKYWTLEHFLESFKQTKEILKKHPNMLHPDSPKLM